MSEQRTIKKILVANRGEIAVRVIRACRDLGIPTVAVYSEADRTSLHVRYADEAVFIGAPAPRESYLKISKILDAAKQTGADAIHPGYGFLSEKPDFSQACQDEGIIFIGPTRTQLRGWAISRLPAKPSNGRAFRWCREPSRGCAMRIFWRWRRPLVFR
jgi:acetyl/propionyl-CoA carboxylase alpha subunit